MDYNEATKLYEYEHEKDMNKLYLSKWYCTEYWFHHERINK
jgi:hypothetical protein